MDKLDKEFIRQYLETALWAECDPDSEEPLDCNFDIYDIDLSTVKRAVKDCLSFIEKAADLIDDYSQAGHDFWLTRNGHGAGFWDRDLGETGDKLTEISKEYPSLFPYVYVVDDETNKIEF